MGDFDLSKIRDITPRPLRRLADPLGLFKKPEIPKPTAQEVELERQQRKLINELTRESNVRLKSIKRGTVGRKTLLGGAGARGIVPGVRAPGAAAQPAAPGTIPLIPSAGILGRVKQAAEAKKAATPGRARGILGRVRQAAEARRG